MHARLDACMHPSGKRAALQWTKKNRRLAAANEPPEQLTIGKNPVMEPTMHGRVSYTVFLPLYGILWQAGIEAELAKSDF